jgi:hypothetical protein
MLRPTKVLNEYLPDPRETGGELAAADVRNPAPCDDVLARAGVRH